MRFGCCDRVLGVGLNSMDGVLMTAQERHLAEWLQLSSKAVRWTRLSATMASRKHTISPTFQTLCHCSVFVNYLRYVVFCLIYIARQLNSRGQVYGFVRYMSVKNRAKLETALNNICIGDFRGKQSLISLHNKVRRLGFLKVVLGRTGYYFRW